MVTAMATAILASIFLDLIAPHDASAAQSIKSNSLI